MPPQPPFSLLFWGLEELAGRFHSIAERRKMKKKPKSNPKKRYPQAPLNPRIIAVGYQLPAKIPPGENPRRPAMQGGGVFFATPSLWYSGIYSPHLPV
jgi:hypothetical protein